MRNQMTQLLSVLEDASTCLSRKVGAIITDKANNILGCGYNGAPINLQSCKDRNYCIRKENNIKSGECLDMCRAVHAEERAILNIAIPDANSLSIDNEPYRLYVSCMPCARCTKLLIEAGIKEIIAFGDYNSEYTKELLKEANVRYIIIKEGEE